MANIVDLLKKGVSSQKKIHNKYVENLLGESLPYKEFKRKNIELLEFKQYLENINYNNYLTKKEINNIFRYFNNNLKSKKYSDVKKILYIIDDITDNVKIKLNQYGDDEIISDSLNHILNHIKLLKELLAVRLNYDYKSLDMTIKFESLIKTIINKDNIKDVDKIIAIIFDNIELLNYHDHKYRTFSVLLYDAIINAKINNHEKLIAYYREIVNFIINIKSLNMDKEKIMSALDIKDYGIVDKSALEEKIANLHYDSRSDRYLLEDDFIISIDNSDTRKIDDALSIENTRYGSYILGIHITDVYSLGLFTNELLNIQRSSENINKIKASLEEFQKKNAISLFVEITNNGLIRDYKILKTRIEVNRNLLYGDVSNILSSSCTNQELSKTLINLVNLYNIVDNDKFPKYPNISNIPHLLVNKYMLLYGCIISEYFIENNIPGIYLEGNNRKNLYTLEKSNYETGFCDFDTYCKTTSPIYDNSSLLCQLVMHKCVFNESSNEEKQVLKYNLQPYVNALNRKHK